MNFTEYFNNSFFKLSGRMLCICFAVCLNANAQSPLKQDLLSLSNKSDNFASKLQEEKLYIQFDKPYYAISDTIWFKAYLLNNYLLPSNRSRIINIDIAADSGKVIKSYRLPVFSGISWGNIALDSTLFSQGTYTIRAYTDWMRNTGDRSFFFKTIYISGGTGDNWLISQQTDVKQNTARIRMQINNTGNVPYALNPVKLTLKSGSKTLYRQKQQTALDGTMDVKFDLPEKMDALTLVMESGGKAKKAVIPIVLNRPDHTDVQFLPEGGNLVAGKICTYCF